MNNQVRFVGKPALTKTAAKRLLASVHPHVAEHVVPPTEDFLANTACMGHPSLIHFFMRDSVSFLVGAFLAGLAGMRLPFDLHYLVATGKLPHISRMWTARAGGMTCVSVGWGLLLLHCHLGPFWLGGGYATSSKRRRGLGNVPVGSWQFIFRLASCTAEERIGALSTYLSGRHNGLDAFPAKRVGVTGYVRRHSPGVTLGGLEVVTFQKGSPTSTTVEGARKANDEMFSLNDDCTLHI